MGADDEGRDPDKGGVMTSRLTPVFSAYVLHRARVGIETPMQSAPVALTCGPSASLGNSAYSVRVTDSDSNTYLVTVTPEPHQ